ncbi:hypothetical protein J1N35_015063, partial [Gossypium stocksii]
VILMSTIVKRVHQAENWMVEFDYFDSITILDKASNDPLVFTINIDDFDVE